MPPAGQSRSLLRGSRLRPPGVRRHDFFDNHCLMRILCVASLLPYPLDGGGNVRISNHLRFLAHRHDVVLLAGSRPDTDAAAIAHVRSDLHVDIATYQPFGYHGIVRGWQRALALSCPPYISAQVSDELRDRLIEEQASADVIVALDDYAAAYFAALEGGVPTVLDKHRLLAPDRVPRIPRRAHDLSDLLLIGFERRAIQRATAVVVTSDVELAKLQARYSPRHPFLVPSEPERVAIRRAPDGKTVAWLGAHAYGPNREGLQLFLENGWNSVGGGARLQIVGKGPSPELERWAQPRADVDVLGFVEDLSEFMERPVAAVVPLWAGGGVKLKTVTFMQAGIPVVGTQAALEGLGAEDGLHVIRGETPGDLAAGLRRLLAEPRLAQRIGRQGQELMEARRARGVGAAAFAEVVEGASSELKKRSDSR